VDINEISSEEMSITYYFTKKTLGDSRIYSL